MAPLRAEIESPVGWESLSHCWMADFPVSLFHNVHLCSRKYLILKILAISLLDQSAKATAFQCKVLAKFLPRVCFFFFCHAQKYTLPRNKKKKASAEGYSLLLYLGN